MKMGRRLRCSSVTSRSRYAPSYASPARTALPAAHFDRNATTPVTDLVHQIRDILNSATPDSVNSASCFSGLLFLKDGHDVQPDPD